jgi:hypothetical protein
MRMRWVRHVAHMRGEKCLWSFTPNIERNEAGAIYYILLSGQTASGAHRASYIGATRTFFPR